MVLPCSTSGSSTEKGSQVHHWDTNFTLLCEGKPVKAKVNMYVVGLALVVVHSYYRLFVSPNFAKLNVI